MIVAILENMWCKSSSICLFGLQIHLLHAKLGEDIADQLERSFKVNIYLAIYQSRGACIGTRLCVLSAAG